MRYIIVEDEPLAAARVRSFADKIKPLEFAGTFDNAIGAMMFLKNNVTDLIFLDINIGDLSGIQLLEIARPACAVIILTAYQEYAMKGFELNVTDYLLKPFTFDRFYQAVARAQTHNRKQEPLRAFIFIKVQHRLEKVMFTDLCYIEGDGDYRILHTVNNELRTLQTFGELQRELPNEQFIRIHRSFIVAFDKIESIERDMIRVRDRLIPVSETYKRILQERISRGK